MLKVKEIYFGEKNPESDQGGLYITNKLWSQFSNCEAIALFSDSNLWFTSDLDLSAQGSISIDAGRIANAKSDGAAISLKAPSIHISNSKTAFSGESDLTNTGQITFEGANITIGSGDVLFGGFKTVALNSQGDLTLKGLGSLVTGNADLQINAARVTTIAGQNADDNYQVANFYVVAGRNKNDVNPANSIVMTAPPNGQPGTTSVPGGMLEFKARRIEVGTVVQMDGGSITIKTAGAKDAEGKFLTVAEDTDGITLGSGGAILSRGTDDAPGGRVFLETDFIDENGRLQSGRIVLGEGSLIDVSAAEQGDAGLISLSAPVNGATINGVILGAARGGSGGSFILDTKEIGDITALNEKIILIKDQDGKVISGGFTGLFDLRTRTGQIDVVEGQTVTAHHIKLRADGKSDDQSGGQINIYGTLNASSDTDGGMVELYAASDLTVYETGKIFSAGSSETAKGGDVLLNSSQGSVDLRSGGIIDVSGGEHGAGGTVYIRAQRDNNDVKIKLDGGITGASEVYAEAVKTFDISDTNTVQHDVISDWLADATDFYNSNVAVKRLGTTMNNFHLLPGLEVVSSGDITWDAIWNQYNAVTDDDGNILSDSTLTRFGEESGEPGVLTLRAAGNLTINNNIVDHPTAMDILTKSGIRDSWAFNLTAGADITSADPLSVIKGTGDLTIANQVLVYTESAPIRFSSGNDTIIGAGAEYGYMINESMQYTLASYDGRIEGHAGRDLVINGGAIQTATGNININIERDLQLNLGTSSWGSIPLGAIRTTGQTTATGSAMLDEVDLIEVMPLGQYWTYAGGGDITLDVGRHIGKKSADGWSTTLDMNAWDFFTEKKIKIGDRTSISNKLFSAAYGSDLTNAAAGLVTMAGGNLFVRTGGDFFAQAGTFGEGDLSLYAGGSMKGRFLNRKGKGEIHSMGDFGDFEDSLSKGIQIELFESQVYVTALGDIRIAAVLNPTLASDRMHISKLNDDFIHCTYNEETSISLKAGADITIAGESAFYKNKPANKIAETVLPATVNVEAGGDISLLKSFTLTASPTGNLRLIAGGDIKGADMTTGSKDHGIMMSDIAPEYWYGLFRSDPDNGDIEDRGTSWISNRTIKDDITSFKNLHGFFKDKDAERQAKADPLHKILGNDTDEVKALKNKPIEIHAGKDIKDLHMYMPKMAEVTANGDILNVTYEGQNNNAGDITKIRAGGDIAMDYAVPLDSSVAQNALQGFVMGGPGIFLVQAGGSIDLGTLKDGIQAISNGRYPRLGTGESTLAIVSGYTFDKTTGDVTAFFDTIRKAGDEYAQLMADGKVDEGEALLKQTREEVIQNFFDTDDNPPQPSDGGDIKMTASQIGTSIGKSDLYIIAARDLNLGQTALPVSGTVSKKTGITTGGGGAINIFAGRDVNVNESRIMTFLGGDITVWSDNGNINAGRGSRTAVSASPPRVLDDGTKVFSPPAIGSGIRAVTYGDNAPEPGNIHLFAPSGIIDAGEAEISGGRIILAAQQVLNVQNIIFSAGSVGVPQPSTGTTGLGSISGSGALTQASQLTSEASGLAAARAAEASKIIEDIMAKWLDVKIVDFVQEDQSREE
jgi:hypothetical protein